MKKVIAGLSVVLVIVGCAVAFSYLTVRTVDLTIASGTRLITTDNEGRSDARWMIFGRHSDGRREQFENSDAPLHLKFNSTSLQGLLEPGTRVRCKVNGWRIELFSTYRNLLECEEIAT